MEGYLKVRVYSRRVVSVMAVASNMDENQNEIDHETGSKDSNNITDNSNEIQDIIIPEIVRIQAKKKRTDLQSLPQAMESRHDLNKGVCEAEIQHMINSGRLKYVMSRGAKSFIIAKDKELTNVEGQISIEANQGEMRERPEKNTQDPRLKQAQEKQKKVETSSDEMNHIKAKESNQDLMWSSIKSLTDSLTRANKLLQKERDYSRKLKKRYQISKLVYLDKK